MNHKNRKPFFVSPGGHTWQDLPPGSTPNCESFRLVRRKIPSHPGADLFAIVGDWISSTNKLEQKGFDLTLCRAVASRRRVWTPLPRCADCHGNPQSRNVLCCLNLCWIEKLPLVNFNIWARYPSYVFEVMCTERVDVSITGGCQSEVWISGRALGARDLVQAASVCTYGQTMAGVSQWNELYFEPWLCRDFCDIWWNYCLWKAVCDCAVE